MYVFDANKPIRVTCVPAHGPLERIPEDQRAILFQEKSYVHSYPHCWRCATPLIYKPVSSWFVSVTKIKDRLLELNQEINWIPGNVKDGQFGKWLANAVTGRSPATVSGVRRFRCGFPMIRSIHAWMCTVRWTS